MSATGRYAPSPTGSLHLGNLRTALLAWLFARSQGASFLVRIDDLDSGRVRPGVAEEQLADLAALGLDWDGAVVRQSARGALYEAAIDALDARGLLYPCYCTRAEIREAASAPHGPPAEGAYPGTCRDLSGAQRAERERAGRPPALRLRAGGAVVSFADRAARRAPRHASTISSCVATIAPRHTIWPWSSMTQIKAWARSSAARISSTPPLASSISHGCSICPPPHTPMSRSCSATTASAWPSAMAPSRWPIAPPRARRRSPSARALAASVGLAGAGEQPALADLLERFDPRAIPTEPSVLTA